MSFQPCFFQKLFGFWEEPDKYNETQQQLAQMMKQYPDKVDPKWTFVEFSVPNNKKPIPAGVFRFETVAEMREYARKMALSMGFGHVVLKKEHHFRCESRRVHYSNEYRDACFQAASQLNALEMADPAVTPEKGIMIYQYDRTQGPACACAGACGTAWRNYFAPVKNEMLCDNAADAEGGRVGQRADNQLNGFKHVQEILCKEEPLFTVKNGYVEITQRYVEVAPQLSKMLEENPAFEQELVDRVRVGVQYDVEASDTRPESVIWPFVVSQVYASACSVGYSKVTKDPKIWEPIGRICLKAAYEATYYAFVIHRCRFIKMGRHTEGPLILTKIGGGVFGNPAPWIVDAMHHGEKKLKALFETMQQTTPNEEGKKMKPLELRAVLGHFGKEIEKGYHGWIVEGDNADKKQFELQKTGLEEIAKFEAQRRADEEKRKAAASAASAN